MNHQLIPRHLNFIDPNPRIDWSRLPVLVTAAATHWPARIGRLARAGVSSFGFSGTNAHVSRGGIPALTGERQRPTWPRLPEHRSRWVCLVTRPGWKVRIPGAGPLEDRACKIRVLPLSARTDQALRDLAGKYSAWLEARVSAIGRGGAANEDSGAGNGRRQLACGHGLDR